MANARDNLKKMFSFSADCYPRSDVINIRAWELRKLYAEAKVKVVWLPTACPEPKRVWMDVPSTIFGMQDLAIVVDAYHCKRNGMRRIKRMCKFIAEEVAQKVKGALFRMPRVAYPTLRSQEIGAPYLFDPKFYSKPAPCSIDSSEVEYTTLIEVSRVEKQQPSGSPHDFSSTTTEDEDEAPSSPEGQLKRASSLASLSSCIGAEFEEEKPPEWNPIEAGELMASFMTVSDDTSVDDVTVIFCPTAVRNGSKSVSEDDNSLESLSLSSIEEDEESNTYSRMVDLEFEENLKDVLEETAECGTAFASRNVKFRMELSVIQEEMANVSVESVGDVTLPATDVGCDGVARVGPAVARVCEERGFELEMADVGGDGAANVESGIACGCKDGGFGLEKQRGVADVICDSVVNVESAVADVICDSVVKVESAVAYVCEGSFGLDKLQIDTEDNEFKKRGCVDLESANLVDVVDIEIVNLENIAVENEFHPEKDELLDVNASTLPKNSDSDRYETSALAEDADFETQNSSDFGNAADDLFVPEDSENSAETTFVVKNEVQMDDSQTSVPTDPDFKINDLGNPITTTEGIFLSDYESTEGFAAKAEFSINPDNGSQNSETCADYERSSSTENAAMTSHMVTDELWPESPTSYDCNYMPELYVEQPTENIYSDYNLPATPGHAATSETDNPSINDCSENSNDDSLILLEVCDQETQTPVDLTETSSAEGSIYDVSEAIEKFVAFARLLLDRISNLPKTAIGDEDKLTASCSIDDLNTVTCSSVAIGNNLQISAADISDAATISETSLISCIAEYDEYADFRTKTDSETSETILDSGIFIGNAMDIHSVKVVVGPGDQDGESYSNEFQELSNPYGDVQEDPKASRESNDDNTRTSFENTSEEVSKDEFYDAEPTDVSDSRVDDTSCFTFVTKELEEASELITKASDQKESNPVSAFDDAAESSYSSADCKCSGEDLFSIPETARVETCPPNGNQENPVPLQPMCLDHNARNAVISANSDPSKTQPQACTTSPNDVTGDSELCHQLQQEENEAWSLDVAELIRQLFSESSDRNLPDKPAESQEPLKSNKSSNSSESVTPERKSRPRKKTVDYNENEVDDEGGSPRQRKYRLKLKLELEWRGDPSSSDTATSGKRSSFEEDSLEDDNRLTPPASSSSPSQSSERLKEFKQNYPKFIQYSYFSPKVKTPKKRLPRTAPPKVRVRNKVSPKSPRRMDRRTNKSERGSPNFHSSDGYVRFSNVSSDWPSLRCHERGGLQSRSHSKTDRQLRGCALSYEDTSLLNHNLESIVFKASTPKGEESDTFGYTVVSPIISSLEEFEILESLLDGDK